MSQSRRIFLIIIAVLVFILVGGFIVWRIPKTPDSVSLSFWGVFDDSDVYANLIARFKEQYPWITISYKKFAYEEYEQALFDAWSLGQGPDLFMIHNTWLPKYQDRLYPYPQSKNSPLNTESFKNVFVPVVQSDFLRQGQIYGIPLYVDSLALYYNEDIFQKAYRQNPDDAWILEPPTTWDEFIEAIKFITEKDEWDNLLRPGAAIGTAYNINRASDILYLIMLQSGTKMIADNLQSAVFDRTTTVDGRAYNPGEEALKFYTDFANPHKKVYTWNIKQDYSIDAFSEGKAAMVFGYSYLAETFKKKNPNLNFKIAPAPQIQQSANPLYYANYWALAVPRWSKHIQEAWSFIEFAARKENVSIYLDKTQRPSARYDMVTWQEQEMSNLGVFARQNINARSWYQIDSTAIEKIFLNMIDRVNLGKASPSRAITEAARELTLLMQPPPPEPSPPMQPPF